jgi:hypothetical protein
MKGCVLYGRFVFSNPAKNRPLRPTLQAKDETSGECPAGSPGEDGGEAV